MFEKNESTGLFPSKESEVIQRSKVAGLGVVIDRRDFLQFIGALTFSALVGPTACVSEDIEDIQSQLTQNFNPLRYPTLEPEQAIDYPSDPIDPEKAKQVIDLFLKESLFVSEEGGSVQAFEIPFDLMVEIQEKENETINLVNPTDFSAPGAAEDLKTKINMALDPEIVRLVDTPIHHTFSISYVFLIAGKHELTTDVDENYINFQLQGENMSILVDKSLNHGLITVVTEALAKNYPNDIMASQQLNTQHHSVSSTVSSTNDGGVPTINSEDIVVDGNHFDKRIDTIESLQQFIRDYSDAPEISAYMISNFVEKEIFDPITDVASFKSFVEIFPSDPIIITSALRLVPPEFLQQIDDIQDFIDVIEVLPKDSAVFEILFQKIEKITFKSSDRVEALVEIIRLMPRDAKIFCQFLGKIIGFALKDHGSKDQFRHPINTLSSGWGDCDDYVVLHYFWAYLQNYNPYIADLDAKESGKLGHVFTWFENEENRIVVLDASGPYEGSYRLLSEGQTIEDYCAQRHQKMVLTDAYIQIS